MNKTDFEKLTPAMRHYVETKRRYPEAFLFYRLGDFYELFFDDAIEVSSLLDLTLTKKSGGLDEKIPMCGVPFRVANQYIKRLVKLGYSVSVCDQVEDPKEAKGLVKREVTKIVTPATFIDEEEGDDIRHLTSIVSRGSIFYLAHCDYSSGKVRLEEKIIWDETEAASFLDKQLSLYKPVEILYDRDFLFLDALKSGASRHHVVKLRQLDISNVQLRGYEAINPANNDALNLLIDFLEKTQFHHQGHLNVVESTENNEFMDLSDTTIRNLELVENNRDSTKDFTLYDTLDLCITKMGSRLLRTKILKPLMNFSRLNRQYDRIDALRENRILFGDIQEQLKDIYDIDRLSLYISNRSMTPKQMLRLEKSLRAFLCICEHIRSSDEVDLFSEVLDVRSSLSLLETLSNVFIEDPPASYQEQRFIRVGFDEDLDRLFDASEGGKHWILQLEERERSSTGIKNLKIKYNKILGYFFEVSKSNIDIVPDYFIRKQTLVGSERFFTEELKEKEDEILHARERALERQLVLLESLREEIAKYLDTIQQLSDTLAELDITCALATVADRYRYVRPQLNDAGVINIKGGRHPVVERSLSEAYIPNDSYLDSEDFLMQVITGPNMAGKSTYMRQVALIQVLAQIGSFVPCDSANLPLVDQIFTRIGATDNLTRGQSTFMVEMTEVSEILRLATSKSLILFDEVGRGTSTYDGLSIAWAIVEYIYKEVRAKTLFATHYFELTELANLYDGIINVTVATEEVRDEIRFLRKIIIGESNYSFGIDVAKLAGVKEEVIDRAREVLVSLENEDRSKNVELVNYRQQVVSENIKPHPVVEKLKSIDINQTTPIEALMLLQSLKDEVEDE